jgi:hypothetical protein
MTPDTRRIILKFLLLVAALAGLFWYHSSRLPR